MTPMPTTSRFDDMLDDAVLTQNRPAPGRAG